MPAKSLLPTFVLAVAVGLAADWVGAPPAWLRRAFNAAVGAAVGGIGGGFAGRHAPRRAR